MLDILDISDSTNSEDLEMPCVCSRCFGNRDIVTRATFKSMAEDEFGEGAEFHSSLLEKSEIKAIYYNLYLDNSDMKNERLHETYPSLSSFEEFITYIKDVLNITILDGEPEFVTPLATPSLTSPPPLLRINRTTPVSQTRTITAHTCLLYTSPSPRD